MLEISGLTWTVTIGLVVALLAVDLSTAANSGPKYPSRVVLPVRAAAPRRQGAAARCGGMNAVGGVCAAVRGSAGPHRPAG